jgi:hypothetical protein
MDVAAVKDRILRLNKEIHEERFVGRDLSYAVGLWERAVDNYRLSNFSQAEALVDEAYRALYLGQADIPQQVVVPQSAPQPQAVVTPLYVVYTDDGDFLDKILHHISQLLYISAMVLIKPKSAFERLNYSKPVSEIMTLFSLFGLVLAASYFWVIAPSRDFNPGAAQIFLSIVVFGFVFCVLISILANQIAKVLGGIGSTAHTATVIGLSLVPVILSAVAFFYYGFSNSLLPVHGSAEPDLANLVVLVALAIVGVGLNIRLQAIGLSMVHHLSEKKGLFSALTTAAASFILLSATAYTLVM